MGLGGRYPGESWTRVSVPWRKKDLRFGDGRSMVDGRYIPRENGLVGRYPRHKWGASRLQKIRRKTKSRRCSRERRAECMDR